jgi:hypothetical protein
MNAQATRLPTTTRCFLACWVLASAFAYHVWFYRVYDRGFCYKPYVLEFEFQMSQILLAVFGVAGLVVYERLRRDLRITSRVLFLTLITAAVSLLVVDSLVARFVPPFFDVH